MEAAVGGGAWLDIQETVKLTGGREDLKLGGVGTLYADTTVVDRMNGEVLDCCGFFTVPINVRF